MSATPAKGPTIGIDVGGTKISGALVDEAGSLLAEGRCESPAQDADAIADAISGLVEELRDGHDVAGVGVAAAGFIDRERTTVLFAPNLAWRNEPLDERITRRVGLPVVIENDANAAAWGEFRFGAGRDARDLLLVTVGTGIGGGVVIDDQLFRGGFGVGAEIGHLTFEPDGRLCGCGNHGCWEQYASGTALVRDTRAEADGSLLAAGLRERAGGDLAAIDGPMITEAARDGDRFALDRLDELGTRLGRGIASLAAVLDPTLVVIGGGVAAAGELLMEPTRRAFAANLTGRGHRPQAALQLAELGNRAGMLGVADLGRPSPEEPA